MDFSSQKTCQYQFLDHKHNLGTSFVIFFYSGVLVIMSLKTQNSPFLPGWKKHISNEGKNGEFLVDDPDT